MAKVKDETSKARIIEVATRLFGQQGYDGTSIRQICKEANANVCMISYYWGGKQELYNGIIEDIIERQTQYVKIILDLEQDFSKWSNAQQVEHLFFVLDKFMDFFYSKNVSKDLIVFMVRLQQSSSSFVIKSPSFDYLRRLIATIFNLKPDSRETIFKTLFIVSQINSARVLPAFSLNLLNQDDFTKEDIAIIKNNFKLYVNTLLKEANIV